MRPQRPPRCRPPALLWAQGPLRATTAALERKVQYFETLVQMQYGAADGSQKYPSPAPSPTPPALPKTYSLIRTDVSVGTSASGDL